MKQELLGLLAVLIVTGIFVAVISSAQEKRIDACEAKGGIYVGNRVGKDICVKPEALLK